LAAQKTTTAQNSPLTMPAYLSFPYSTSAESINLTVHRLRPRFHIQYQQKLLKEAVDHPYIFFLAAKTARKPWVDKGLFGP